MEYEDALALAKHSFAQEINTIHRAYVDLAGDLIAGILLSQIMYWCLPDNEGNSKLRVKKQGVMWLAKTREDWYSEIRITPKQYDRAIKILENKNLIEKCLFRFDGSPTVHIRPNLETYNRLVDEWVEQKAAELMEKDTANPVNITFFPKGKNPISPKVKMELPERVKTLTETTTEITKERLLNKENGESNSQANHSPRQSNEDLSFEQEKWEWQSDKQYLDYREKILPKMITSVIATKHSSRDTRDAFNEVFARYFDLYDEYNDHYHPWYTKETVERVIDSISEFFNGRIDVDEINEYIDQFFSHPSLRGKPMLVFASYNMLHVIQNIVDNDWREVFCK